MGSGLPGGSDDGSAAGPSDASVRDLRDERRELPLPRVHEDQNRERHQEAQRRQERKLIPSQPNQVFSFSKLNTFSFSTLITTPSTSRCGRSRACVGAVSTPARLRP